MGFRENVKLEMEFADIQGKELAAKAGIKLQTLWSYLGGRAKAPSAEAAVRIAGALGVSVEYLVTGQDAASRHGLASFPPDTRRLFRFMETLDAADRKILLTVAALLQERESAQRPRPP